MLKKPPAAFSHRSDPQRTPEVRLRSSLAAALLDGLFEHLAYIRRYDSMYRHSSVLRRKTDFSAAC